MNGLGEVCTVPPLPTSRRVFELKLHELPCPHLCDISPWSCDTRGPHRSPSKYCQHAAQPGAVCPSHGGDVSVLRGRSLHSLAGRAPGSDGWMFTPPAVASLSLAVRLLFCNASHQDSLAATAPRWNFRERRLQAEGLYVSNHKTALISHNVSRRPVNCSKVETNVPSYKQLIC